MNNNRFKGPRLVAIAIRRSAGRIVLNGDILDIHCERRVVQICVPTSPLHGTHGLISSATHPVPNFDLHRCLRVVVTAEGVGV
jgi:hypothetical protein